MGNGIRQSGIDRKELFLVTKVNFKSYENAEQAVMQSLENLQTGYLDLMLLHWPFANYYAARRTPEKLYADGKVHAIGVSNFEPDRLLDLIAYNKVIPAVNQIETSLYCQRGAERGWMGIKHIAHKFRTGAGPFHIADNMTGPAAVGTVALPLLNKLPASQICQGAGSSGVRCPIHEQRS